MEVRVPRSKCLKGVAPKSPVRDSVFCRRLTWRRNLPKLCTAYREGTAGSGKWIYLLWRKSWGTKEGGSRWEAGMNRTPSPHCPVSSLGKSMKLKSTWAALPGCVCWGCMPPGHSNIILEDEEGAPTGAYRNLGARRPPWAVEALGGTSSDISVGIKRKAWRIRNVTLKQLPFQRTGSTRQRHLDAASHSAVSRWA